jgi:hypothetical protein
VAQFRAKSVNGRYVRNIVLLVGLIWLAGISAVIIANLNTSGAPQIPIPVLKPTPSPTPNEKTSPELTGSPSPGVNAKPRMIWQVNTSEVKDLATVLGILLGGFWAYFKFFKGRTFKARLEPRVTGKIIDQGNISTLIVSMEIKNVGLGVVYLSDLTSIDVYETDLETSAKPTKAKWGRSPKTYRAFAEHSWIEPEETVRDEILLRLPGVATKGYRVDLVVRSENRSLPERWTSWQTRRRMGGHWSSTSVSQKEPAEEESLKP